MANQVAPMPTHFLQKANPKFDAGEEAATRERPIWSASVNEKRGICRFTFLRSFVLQSSSNPRCSARRCRGEYIALPREVRSLSLGPATCETRHGRRQKPRRPAGGENWKGNE